MNYRTRRTDVGWIFNPTTEGQSSWLDVKTIQLFFALALALALSLTLPTDAAAATSSGESITSIANSATSPEPVKPALQNRLLAAGALLGLVLGELAVLFGYLKAEHATRGFYSGRLQSMAVVASVAVLAAAYLFYWTWKINA